MWYVRTLRRLLLTVFVYFFQQEARLERQEERLHNKAVRAAVHGNVGRAIHLEVGFGFAMLNACFCNNDIHAMKLGWTEQVSVLLLHCIDLDKAFLIVLDSHATA